MSNIVKNLQVIKSSDFELIHRINSEYTRAYEAEYPNRMRSQRNWGAYSAVDGRAWESEDMQDLIDEGRPVNSFNITAPKVDTLTGSLTADKWEHDFVPVDGVRNSLTEAAKETSYADKELCNYDKRLGDVIRDGLVYAGDLKMVISPQRPFGNITFKRVEPGFLIRDPYWISDDDAECIKCWEIFHMDAIQIKRKFNISSPQIDSAIQTLQKLGGTYGNDDQPTKRYQWGVHQEFKGHLYRVIEFHWIENLNTSRIIGQRMDSSRWIPFPVTQDRSRLEEFMLRNKIDPETMIESPYEDRIHKFATICPQISNLKLLTYGISKVQPKRLPYYHFTVDRSFGKDKGIVDDIIDIQRTINKRESKLTDLISTATGGGKLVNRDLFKTDGERREFKDKNNDPNYVGWVDGDELTKEKAMHYLNSNQFPSTLINQLERMWDIVDRVSKVPAAMAAMSESSNESGILFERKLQASQLGTLTLKDRVRTLRKNVWEGYLEQWPLAYKGIHREFSTRDGKHRAELNKRVFNAAEGRWYIQNRPGDIPRCSVIITEAASSPTQAMRKQALFSEFYNISVKGNQQDFAEFFYSKMLKTVDFSDEDKAELEQLELLMKIKRYKRITAEIANLDATAKQAALAGLQATMNIEQLLGPQQQPQNLPISQVPEEEALASQPIEMQEEQMLPQP